MTLRGAAVASLGLLTLIAVLSFTRRDGVTAEDIDGLYDPIVAGEDFPGGIRWVVSRDGIRPIYEPAFIAPDESPVEPEDLVIGVVVGDDVRAYPVGLLAAREIVNDTVGDVPVIVSWCPLCGTGSVHRRAIDGDEVVFGNQGALWGNAMTWFDHDTGSIWSQPLGMAIAGPHEGTRLELMPSTLTTWQEWQEAHPDTLILDGPSYWPGTTLEDLAVVVEIGDDSVAYPMTAITEAGVINDEVGGIPIAVIGSQPRQWALFERRAGGDVLILEPTESGLVDSETGSTWNPTTGEATAGPMAGQVLESVPALTVFPADFPTFWPSGRIYEQ